MLPMRIINTTAQQWGVFTQMRRVLCQAGAECQAQQAPGRENAGRDCTPAGRTWPGRGTGVRGPEVDETPLSAAEVAHYLEHCDG